MSSVMLNVACSFFDIKNIEESRLPSKTGAIRFLAVSALVASVFASALIPAVICTGVIAATTAAIMLKSKKIEQLNENIEPLNGNDVVNSFKGEINSYSKEKKYGLLTVCLSCLTERLEEMPEMINVTIKTLGVPRNSTKATKSYLLEGIEKYAKVSGNELVKEDSEGKMTIKLIGDQEKIKGLSVVSTLSIVEHLYTQLGKSDKANEIKNLIN